MLGRQQFVDGYTDLRDVSCLFYLFSNVQSRISQSSVPVKSSNDSPNSDGYNYLKIRKGMSERLPALEGGERAVTHPVTPCCSPYVE